MAVASQCPTSSRVWSCSTLRDGVEDLVSRQRELEAEENELERQIEEMASQILRDAQGSSPGNGPERSDRVHQAEASPEDETQKATSEEFQQAGLPTPMEVDAPKAEGYVQANIARPVATPTRGLAPDVAEPGSHQTSEQKGDDDNSKAPEVPSLASAPTPSENAADGSGLPKKAPQRTRKERLREAAKQRIRRMVMRHKRAHLNVPQFVVDEWKSRDQNTMAHLLMEKNWDKAAFIAELEVIVTKKKTISIRVEEQWVSEKEMKSDLKWSPLRIAGAKKVCEAKPDTHCRKNAYDGEFEFYVVVRETGARQLEKTEEEILRSKKKADEGPTLGQDTFAGLEQAAQRTAAEDAEAKSAKSGGSAPSQIQETRVTFTKFMQSMLQKSGKIRSLVRELKDKYAKCDSTAENVNTLQKGLKLMDEEYDKCSTLLAEAELKGFDVAFVKKANDIMASATYKCSSACTSEMKIRFHLAGSRRRRRTRIRRIERSRRVPSARVRGKLLMRMRVRIRKPQRQSPVRLRKPKLRSDPLGPAADHLINLAGSLFDFMS
ncbi:unnamed protein product [Cladocopium goreaui]|uniref:Uncharacterized protein n=1 Tax=Cladocopium goreaui TaxID=2562237 RepID=A0A9P1BJN2_9DINO|nr:unnamed protein product [Cladocopium goreaui]